ncbi:MAG: hypothetical protein LLG00_09940 [Planctomycetaceae bacterium]|nr:hypothetical protein [Planctomycetaceae bacterium]
MSSAETPERRAGVWKTRIDEAIHDPVKLRIMIIAALLMAGYYFVCRPLDERILLTGKRLSREVKVVELAARAAQLQKDYGVVSPRVPPQTDAKEWVQYVLDGIRRLPVKMRRFDCRDPKPFGPLKVVAFQIDLEGTFFDLDKFLRWLEGDKRIFRVDDISLAPIRGTGNLNMRLTLLGLSG